MIDAHVHLEKGDYSVEWIKQCLLMKKATHTMPS